MRRPLSLVVIRNLMLDVLEDKEFCQKFSGGYNFIDSGGTHESNLLMLVEVKAIKQGLIDEKRKVKNLAWGGAASQLIENSTTNFNRTEIERLYECFHLLLTNNIIAPGMHANCPTLPYFHITDHGLACLKEKEILPYDIDGYLSNLKQAPNLDEWVEFYITEALKCYHVNCCNAAIAMIGLASERLIELLLVEAVAINDTLKAEIEKERHISVKYSKFLEYYPSIKKTVNIKYIFDKGAQSTFFTYLRLNRNEVDHPSEIKKDNTETLLMFIAFTKYCSIICEIIKELQTFNSTKILDNK